MEKKKGIILHGQNHWSVKTIQLATLLCQALSAAGMHCSYERIGAHNPNGVIVQSR